MPNLHGKKDLLSQIMEGNAACVMKNLISKRTEADLKKNAVLIADIFNCAPVFEQLMQNPSASRNVAEKKLIKSFYNNLMLLVQKTWVEKSDEALKAQVIFQLSGVCDALKEKKYADVYEKFMLLLRDTVYLLFGQQAKKDDFGEYALRIDPDFGVFWHFLQNTPSAAPETEAARMYILLGMCFLANY